MDLLRSKENSFRGDHEPKVMATVLLNILEYVATHKFLGLDESQWPLSPFFMRAIRKIVRTVSLFKGCAFLTKSEAWKGTKWYLNVLRKLVKEGWKIDKAIRRECKWALKNINIANSVGYGLWTVNIFFLERVHILVFFLPLNVVEWWSRVVSSDLWPLLLRTRVFPSDSPAHARPPPMTSWRHF